MPRAIVVHAGFHKTGTSTIQGFLRHNRKALMPHLAIRLKGQMQDLIHATRGYSTWRDPLTLDKARHRFDALLDSLPKMPKRTLCLSAEELGGHMPGRSDIMEYDAAPVLIGQMVRQLQTRFPDAPVTVYLGTRARETWQHSAWGEHVKSSAMTLDFAGFCAAYPLAGDLDKAARDIAASVPCATRIEPLERCADLRLGPVAPLLDLCGIPAPVLAGLSPEPRRNTALDAATLAALLDANRRFADRDQRQAAKAAILNKATRS